ncbi:MAG: hypothetical protein BZY75_03035 [SAR202 cluster bacterium Io17-Chloro-G7]|nr:MAG: hypothetical protein BZY75_03035 [SAR202 cluster bacterium Io17-Chloro-G7]
MPREEVVPVDSGAEAFVELLNAHDVDCIFLNSGTDTFPVQEAVSKFSAQGRRTPRIIVCPDELVAISAAHGHYLVSGRPQVVLVHVDAGTMQLGGGLHNAQRGRIGVILCAGRAPLTLEGELPGSRDLWIHWIQEQIDQAASVRGFCKWDYELRRNESIHHVIDRAFQVASSQPSGPVYLTLPREVLMEDVEGVRVSFSKGNDAPVTPVADPAALRLIAQHLAKAERPLIITGHSGKSPPAVSGLTDVAELVGAPVVSSSSRMNLPTNHPLWAGISARPYLSDADVILIVDCDVPYIPVEAKPDPEAKIHWIDIDPVKESIPLFSFPADSRILADSGKALPALASLLKEVITGEDRDRIEKRSQAVSLQHQGKRENRQKSAAALSGEKPIATDWLTHCINQAIGPDTLVLEETVTNAPSVANALERTLPGSIFTSGGSSLGWGLGAGLGSKLAAPHRDVVVLVGDGAFIYGCPTATLWAAQAHGAPFLTVVFNNQMHHATKRAWLGGYPQGYGQSAGEFVGVNLTPSPDYAMLAQACQAYGELVEEPAELPGALQRALSAVRSGQAAVLDVRIQRP